MKCLIIGFGNMGKIHAKYLTKRNIDWCWCDPSEVGPANKRSSIDKVLDFDRVFITSPEDKHHENYWQVRHGGYRGHIFIEKPVALEISHVNTILEDKKVFVGMVERFNPAIQTLKQAIDKDKLINIDFSRCCVSTRSSKVSILEDIGIHDIDLLFYLLELDEIKGHSITTKDNTTVFTSTSPLARMIWSKDTFFKERKIVVRLTDCTYEVDLQEQSVVMHWEVDGNHVSQPLFVEKSSPVQNEHDVFLSQNVKNVDCKKSHEFLLSLLEVA